MVSVIKVDFRATTIAEQEALAKRYLARGIRMLAEKIETTEEFQRACEMGYQYFQGYFFARPVIVSRREIPGSKLGYLRVLEEVHHPELELVALEALIQQEVSLASKLLRYINSSIFGWIKPVQSIRQALALLGEQEIRNWISLAALPALACDKPDELIRTALVRARFSELLAQGADLDHRKADLFLMGLFSLLDAMLSRPLAEILAELRLGGDIADALLGTERPGQRLAGIYALVRQYEAGDWEALSDTAARLNISKEIVADLYIDAIAWADEIFREGPLGVLAHMPRQRTPCPHLRRITEILRLGTGQMNYPGFGLFGDRGFFGAVVRVFQRRTGTHRQSLGNPLPYALAGHANGTGNLRDGLAGMIAQHDARPLRFPPRRRPRIS